MQVTVNPNLIARFRTALGKLELPDDHRVLCAVSGGPDSMALLLLAQEALRGRVVAATVDHQLRPESGAEAEYVHKLCIKFNVPHVILTPDNAICGNIQSSARAARYALLDRAADEQNCAYVMTAHHADDQLETMLMRLARGSGVDGLSAIRAKNGRIIRPLLDFNKAELVNVCARAGIEPIDDPSNANADYARVAMRTWLASTDHPFRADRAARTANALSEASDALSWMTDMLVLQRISQADGMVICDARDIPDELKRRLLIRALAMLEPDLAPRGDALDRLLVDLSNGRTTTIGNIKCLGDAPWRFTPAPPRRN